MGFFAGLGTLLSNALPQIGSGLAKAAPSLLGGLLGSGTPGPEQIDYDELAKRQLRTQGLVDENLGLARQLQDPQSAINMQMRNMLAQNAMNQGAQVSSQMQKLGAMSGMSPGQIAMQQRIGMNQATGGVNQNWMNALQKRFSQGTGIMGQMTGLQQGLDENMGNAYLTNLNMRNQFAQDRQQGGLGGLMGGFMMGQKMDLGGGLEDFISQLFQKKSDTEGEII